MKDFSLNEEVISDFHVTRERKEIWKIELDLLNKLTEVCKKNNLKFYADAGTLLGAVRHKGFIPWDDDIDVVMFRDDYDKLIELAKNGEFEEPYFLQSAYTEKGYARGHAQLRNSNTTGILKGEQGKVSFNQGIFMDIFVLDGIPSNEKALSKERRKINFLNKLINIKMYPNAGAKKSIKKRIRKLLSYVLNLEKIFSLKEKILKKVDINSTEYVAPLGFVFEVKKRIRNKHLYDEIVMLDFENTKIPAPKEYDLYLQNRYGKDYMIPKNIPTSHGNVIFDTKKSYREYINGNVKDCDKDE